MRLSVFTGLLDPDGPPVKVSRKPTLDQQFSAYYSELLTTYLQRVNQPTASGKMFEASELSDDNTKLNEQIQEIDNNINCTEYSNTREHVVYGYALAKIKIQYFITCSLCQSQNVDMFTILSCMRCVKASNANHDAFMNHVKALDLKVVKSKKSYDISYINFFIFFAGLCTEFPNFKNIPWNSTKLKKFMSHWYDQLEIDRHIWADTE